MRPIHVAAKLGHMRIVKSLLLARADPKQKTSRGRTAVQIARKADKERALVQELHSSYRNRNPQYIVVWPLKPENNMRRNL